jgi:hypothetical protein
MKKRDYLLLLSANAYTREQTEELNGMHFDHRSEIDEYLDNIPMNPDFNPFPNGEDEDMEASVTEMYLSDFIDVCNDRGLYVDIESVYLAHVTVNEFD